MKAVVGISRTLSYLDLQPGALNYWCVHKSYDIAPGDLILLYFPRAASAKHQGIRQIYEAVSAPFNPTQGRCFTAGMQEVPTRLLLTLQSGVTTGEMKVHPILQQWGALKRNFQGVTFGIPDDIWAALRDYIVEKNVEAEEAFR